MLELHLRDASRIGRTEPLASSILPDQRGISASRHPLNPEAHRWIEAKELTNAGGFYAIAVKGLGKTAGLITGIIATIGYNAFVAGALGTIGFFAGMVVAPHLFGVELDWC